MRKRWATSLPLAVAAMLLHGSVAIAWAPAEGDRVFAGDNVAQKYHYAADVNQWLKTAFNDAAADFTAVGNDTRAPTFSHLADAGFKVWYRTNANTPDSEHCPSNVNWRACTEFFDPPLAWGIKQVTFSSEWTWCEPNGVPDGCYYLRRTGLHELGHGAGLYWQPNAGHYGGGPPSSVSVMGASNTLYVAPKPGSNPPGLGRCDLMELAREYDLDSMTDPVPDCEEDLPAEVLTDGDITTVITHTASATYVCPGSTVALSGTLRLIDKPADDKLGLLANNPLTGRTVKLYRKVPGGTYTLLTSHTVGSGSTGPWSTSVTYGSPVTYVFQARYSPGLGDQFVLAAASSIERTVQWASPC
jgi:hypothetical protein